MIKALIWNLVPTYLVFFLKTKYKEKDKNWFKTKIKPKTKPSKADTPKFFYHKNLLDPHVSRARTDQVRPIQFDFRVEQAQALTPNFKYVSHPISAKYRLSCCYISLVELYPSIIHFVSKPSRREWTTTRADNIVLVCDWNRPALEFEPAWGYVGLHICTV